MMDPKYKLYASQLGNTDSSPDPEVDWQGEHFIFQFFYRNTNDFVGTWQKGIIIGASIMGMLCLGLVLTIVVLSCYQARQSSKFIKQKEQEQQRGASQQYGSRGSMSHLADQTT